MFKTLTRGGGISRILLPIWLALWAFAVPAWAQQALRGKVVDAKGEPLAGVSVVVKGTVTGTVTDIDGNYTLTPQVGETVVFSFIGFKNQEHVFNGSSIDVTLEEAAHDLDELVVVGYGATAKRDLTGAVSQVTMDEVLGDRPVINAAAALQGAMPGLMVSGGSGPGQGKSFQIRGTLSINGGSPLVLIDNVEGDLSTLNPDDIESVTVLKDAASSAIYGARAAGGVILITTKRPKSDARFSVTYSISRGWERSIGRPKQASLSDYIAAYEEAGYSSQYWAGDGQIGTWKELLEQYRAGTLQGVGDNGIYRHSDGHVYYLKEGDPQGNALGTGELWNHNLSAEGGTDKLRFRISGNLSKEDGPMVTDKDKYTRKAISAYVSADVTDWYTQEVTMRYSDTKQTAAASLIRDPYATRLISWYPEGYMPGSILRRTEDLIIDSPKNALEVAPVSTTRNSRPRIQLKATFKPLKNWDIVGEYSFDRNDYRYEYYSGVMQYADVQLAVKNQPTTGLDTYTINQSTTKYNAANIYSTYSLELGRHKASLMLGYNQEKSWYGYLNASIDEQAVRTVPSFEGGTGDKRLSDGYTEYAIRAGFGRLSYSFDDKYLLTVNARYDGSSKFPKSERFGFFPSVSAGWRLGQEGFMEWSRTVLDDIKIRGSYGSIGNQNISPYGFVSQMSVSQGTTWLSGDERVSMISVPGLVRANYTWETVKTLDIGFDLYMLDNRLSATFDWYRRTTEGMLASGVELPSVVGASAPTQNVADMRTDGWELAVTWRDRVGDWNYSVSLNVYDHMSEILKYNNESGNIGTRYKGQKLNEIWGYESDGFYSRDDFDLTEVTSSSGPWTLKEGVTSIQGVNPQPGDEKFKDLNGDGTINTGTNTLSDPGDRKIIGNSTSRFQYGANLSVGWKGLDLSAMLQGVGKRDVLLGGASLFPFGGATDGMFFPIYYNQTDYWRARSYDRASEDFMVPVNPDAKLFRVYGGMGNAASNTRTSTKYLQSGAYMRIKNVTLSYTFPRALLAPIYVNNLRVYVSCENLATFTSLPKGYDPESLAWSYPFYRTVSVGASITF